MRQICSALRLLPLAPGCSKFRGGLIMENLRLFAVAGVTTPPVELSRYETWGNLWKKAHGYKLYNLHAWLTRVSINSAFLIKSRKAWRFHCQRSSGSQWQTGRKGRSVTWGGMETEMSAIKQHQIKQTKTKNQNKDHCHRARASVRVPKQVQDTQEVKKNFILIVCKLLQSGQKCHSPMAVKKIKILPVI